MYIYWVLRGAGVSEDCGFRDSLGWHLCTLRVPQTHLTPPELLPLQYEFLCTPVCGREPRTVGITCAKSPHTGLPFPYFSSLSKRY